MPEPSADLARVIEVVDFQARACAGSGSPLYGVVLEAVADDLRAGGLSADLLTGREEDPFASALSLRFLGAVHRIVLEGRAPELGRFYPSVGGTPGGAVGGAFLATVRAHEPEVRRRLEDGVQTNEVGRSAALVGGYAAVASATGLPLRVLEVGSSAGLNLRWDHFAYDTGRTIAGDPASPVRFAGVWEGDPPPLPERFAVAARAGCDRSPIDATTEDGRLSLMAFVWPDQLERLALLDAAIAVARAVPATVDRAPAATWVEDRLREPVPGTATVVVHSIVFQYLSADERERFRAALRTAGERATEAAPLAWLRMEPAGERAEVRLTTWPSGEEQVLATSGYHGRPVWWSGAG